MVQLPMQVVFLFASNHNKFLLCLIVGSAPSTSVSFPDPGTPIFSREDNTERT